MPREYFRGDWQEDYAYSPAVAVQGARTVYLAGVGATHDEEGNSLEGDFDAQVRDSFREMGETLARAGGTLQDIVTMTVWILEPRYSRRFTQIRKEFFPDGFPASALITVRGFALPEMLVEIQAIAVVGDEPPTPAASAAAQRKDPAMPREYHQGTWEQVRALSPAVVTRGGRVVWLSGDIGASESEEELAGQSIEHDRTHFPPDFDSQVHNTFRRIGATLGKVGGTLHDIVKMTVYIKDGRNQQRFVELRKGYFPENAPASTLITITGFAIPEMQIEIDAIAVIGDE